MSRNLDATIGIKVDPETKQLYKNELTGKEKEILIETVRQFIYQAVRKRDILKPQNQDQEQRKIEITIKHEFTDKEQSFPNLHKRLEKLEKELAKALEENASLKNQLDECKAESQKQPTHELEKELVKLRTEINALKKDLDNYKYYIHVIYAMLMEINEKDSDNVKVAIEKILRYIKNAITIDQQLLNRALITARNL